MLPSVFPCLCGSLGVEETGNDCAGKEAAVILYKKDLSARDKMVSANRPETDSVV